MIGVDEAGRGPLAGPVVAAAVSLPEGFTPTVTIRDSKLMTPKARETAFLEIWERAQVGVGIMAEAVVDSMNILRASQFAMNVAVRRLLERLTDSPTLLPQFNQNVRLLIDGNIFYSEVPYAYETIVDGDAKCLSIACASIIAKVTRDRILLTYDRVFPQWGFAQHKGYGTASHRDAIKKYGLTPIHRRSFTHV